MVSRIRDVGSQRSVDAALIARDEALQSLRSSDQSGSGSQQQPGAAALGASQTPDQAAGEAASQGAAPAPVAAAPAALTPEQQAQAERAQLTADALGLGAPPPSPLAPLPAAVQQAYGTRGGAVAPRGQPSSLQGMFASAPASGPSAADRAAANVQHAPARALPPVIPYPSVGMPMNEPGPWSSAAPGSLFGVQQPAVPADEQRWRDRGTADSNALAYLAHNLQQGGVRFESDLLNDAGSAVNLVRSIYNDANNPDPTTRGLSGTTAGAAINFIGNVTNNPTLQKAGNVVAGVDNAVRSFKKGDTTGGSLGLVGLAGQMAGNKTISGGAQVAGGVDKIIKAKGGAGGTLEGASAAAAGIGTLIGGKTGDTVGKVANIGANVAGIMTAKMPGGAAAPIVGAVEAVSGLFVKDEKTKAGISAAAGVATAALATTPIGVVAGVAAAVMGVVKLFSNDQKGKMGDHGQDTFTDFNNDGVFDKLTRDNDNDKQVWIGRQDAVHLTLDESSLGTSWDRGDKLPMNQLLGPKQTMTSRNGEFKLTMQEDGNLVVTDKSGKPTWQSNTAGFNASVLMMQGDGNLMTYRPGAEVGKFLGAWNSGVPAAPTALMNAGKTLDLGKMSVEERAHFMKVSSDPAIARDPAKLIAALSAPQQVPPGFFLHLQDDGKLTVKRGAWEAPGSDGGPVVWSSDQSAGSAVMPHFEKGQKFKDRGLFDRESQRREMEVRDFDKDGDVDIRWKEKIKLNDGSGHFNGEMGRPEAEALGAQREAERAAAEAQRGREHRASQNRTVDMNRDGVLDFVRRDSEADTGVEIELGKQDISRLRIDRSTVGSTRERGSELRNDQVLVPRQTLTSDNGRWQLSMQDNGNLELRDTQAAADAPPAWQSNSAGFAGSALMLGGDGNLVTYRPTAQQGEFLAAWNSGSAQPNETSGPFFLKVQDDGKFTINRGTGAADNRGLIFDSSTSAGAAVLPQASGIKQRIEDPAAFDEATQGKALEVADFNQDGFQDVRWKSQVHLNDGSGGSTQAVPVNPQAPDAAAAAPTTSTAPTAPTMAGPSLGVATAQPGAKTPERPGYTPYTPPVLTGGRVDQPELKIADDQDSPIKLKPLTQQDLAAMGGQLPQLDAGFESGSRGPDFFNPDSPAFQQRLVDTEDRLAQVARINAELKQRGLPPGELAGRAGVILPPTADEPLGQGAQLPLFKLGNNQFAVVAADRHGKVLAVAVGDSEQQATRKLQKQIDDDHNAFQQQQARLAAIGLPNRTVDAKPLQIRDPGRGAGSKPIEAPALLATRSDQKAVSTLVALKDGSVITAQADNRADAAKLLSQRLDAYYKLTAAGVGTPKDRLERVNRIQLPHKPSELQRIGQTAGEAMSQPLPTTDAAAADAPAAPQARIRDIDNDMIIERPATGARPDTRADAGGVNSGGDRGIIDPLATWGAAGTSTNPINDLTGQPASAADPRTRGVDIGQPTAGVLQDVVGKAKEFFGGGGSQDAPPPDSEFVNTGGAMKPSEPRAQPPAETPAAAEKRTVYRIPRGETVELQRPGGGTRTKHVNEDGTVSNVERDASGRVVGENWTDGQGNVLSSGPRPRSYGRDVYTGPPPGTLVEGDSGSGYGIQQVQRDGSLRRVDKPLTVPHARGDAQLNIVTDPDTGAVSVHVPGHAGGPLQFKAGTTNEQIARSGLVRQALDSAERVDRINSSTSFVKNTPVAAPPNQGLSGVIQAAADSPLGQALTNPGKALGDLADSARNSPPVQWLSQQVDRAGDAGSTLLGTVGNSAPVQWAVEQKDKAGQALGGVIDGARSHTQGAANYVTGMVQDMARGNAFKPPPEPAAPSHVEQVLADGSRLNYTHAAAGAQRAINAQLKRGETPLALDAQQTGATPQFAQTYDLLRTVTGDEQRLKGTLTVPLDDNRFTPGQAVEIQAYTQPDGGVATVVPGVTGTPVRIDGRDDGELIRNVRQQLFANRLQQEVNGLSDAQFKADLTARAYRRDPSSMTADQAEQRSRPEFWIANPDAKLLGAEVAELGSMRNDLYFESFGTQPAAWLLGNRVPRLSQQAREQQLESFINRHDLGYNPLVGGQTIAREVGAATAIGILTGRAQGATPSLPRFAFVQALQHIVPTVSAHAADQKLGWNTAHEVAIDGVAGVWEGKLGGLSPKLAPQVLAGAFTDSVADLVKDGQTNVGMNLATNLAGEIGGEIGRPDAPALRPAAAPARDRDLADYAAGNGTVDPTAPVITSLGGEAPTAEPSPGLAARPQPLQTYASEGRRVGVTHTGSIAPVVQGATQPVVQLGIGISQPGTGTVASATLKLNAGGDGQAIASIDQAQSLPVANQMVRELIATARQHGQHSVQIGRSIVSLDDAQPASAQPGGFTVERNAPALQPVVVTPVPTRPAQPTPPTQDGQPAPGLPVQDSFALRGRGDIEVSRGGSTRTPAPQVAVQPLTNDGTQLGLYPPGTLTGTDAATSAFTVGLPGQNPTEGLTLTPDALGDGIARAGALPGGTAASVDGPALQALVNTAEAAGQNSIVFTTGLPGRTDNTLNLTDPQVRRQFNLGPIEIRQFGLAGDNAGVDLQLPTTAATAPPDLSQLQDPASTIQQLDQLSPNDQKAKEQTPDAVKMPQTPGQTPHAPGTRDGLTSGASRTNRGANRTSAPTSASPPVAAALPAADPDLVKRSRAAGRHQRRTRHPARTAAAGAGRQPADRFAARRPRCHARASGRCVQAGAARPQRAVGCGKARGQRGGEPARSAAVEPAQPRSCAGRQAGVQRDVRGRRDSGRSGVENGTATGRRCAPSC